MQPAQTVRHARGFTIVEVLVALLVLSIGLLGVAKLVMYSARGNDSAYLRTQATELAYAILDNMRANRTSARGGSYDTGFGAAGAPGNCLAAACTTAGMATYDVSLWKTRLAAALPAGDGQIVTATAAGLTSASITVRWEDAVAQSTYHAVAAGVSAPLTVTLDTLL
jgi:type IV pilus assembly protein PilV